MELENNKEGKIMEVSKKLLGELERRIDKLINKWLSGDISDRDCLKQVAVYWALFKTHDDRVVEMMGEVKND